MNEALRKLMLRELEVREKLNGLQEKPDRTDEDNAELRQAREDYGTVTRELRQALAKEGDDAGKVEPADQGGQFVTAEDRERAEIRSRCHVMDWVTAAAAGTGVSGAAAELAAACNTPGEMPVSMLFGEPPREDREREDRAAATVAAGAIAENPDPTAGEVFVSPLAARLGIRTPTVAAGVKAYPYIGTGVSPAAVAKGSAIGDSSPAISALSASPKALSATFDFQREDAATLADLDAALSQNLRESLGDEFDSQIVAGDNQAPNLNGLLTQRAPTAPADNALTTFAQLVAATAPFVDGKFAESYEQVQLVTSPRVAHHLKALFRTGTEDDAYSWLRRNFGGITISSRAPQIPQTNHATPGSRRAGGGGLWAVRTRVASLAYAPIWTGIQFVRDEISGAKSRLVTVTAFMLAGGVAIVRPDAYAVATVQTVAGVAP